MLPAFLAGPAERYVSRGRRCVAPSAGGRHDSEEVNNAYKPYLRDMASKKAAAHDVPPAGRSGGKLSAERVGVGAGQRVDLLRVVAPGGDLLHTPPLARP